MSNPWNTDAARHTYAVPYWGDGYVDVSEAGEIVMRPRGAKGPALSLPQIVDRARSEGLRLPLLVRFPDILADRLARLQGAFARAISDNGYAGGYTAIYPIKVNQQRGVAGELVAAGTQGFGLEAGSKPELMAVLAMARPGSIVICNGYKDREYIRLALIGRKLGLRVFIVIEKLSELEHVFSEAKALGVEPLLGVRVRLASIGAGKWQNTGGDKGKFGLSPSQVLTLIERLDAAGLKHTLRLQHFHMGSQISNVRDIANGMREATRYFVELTRLGVPLEIVDVGGGLGVDYEGTRSRSYNSINYSIEQYAARIRFIEARNQARQRRLATARTSDQSGHGSGRTMQANSVKCSGSLTWITHGHITDFDLAATTCHLYRALINFGRGVDDLEQIVSRGNAALHHRLYRRQPL